ncbi:hypothetical protein DTO046C5_1520 [Penicillium roqueforti]|nr:hypothetical protein DTO046C5_1520 [Penicillium roqueforti]
MALNTSSSCHQGLTPPDSPTKVSTMPPATLKDLMHLFSTFLENALLDLADQEPPNTPVSQDQSPPGLDIVRLKRLIVKLTDDKCTSAKLSLATKPTRSSSTSNEQEENIQADKEAYKYKIAEPTETRNDLDNYAKYTFVIRERVNRTSEEVVPFIDIKSEGLRDILRDILHNIKAVSLIDDKPSIEQTVLFHFLPELNRYIENIDNSSDYKSAQAELRLLIDHLKHTYAYISQRLESMLQHSHITYNLL